MAFGSNSSFNTNTAPKGKNLNPGKQKCRVTHVTCMEVQWKTDKTPRLMLSLHLESEKPSDDFVGFMIDPENASKGNYEGQVGYVKSSSWGYQDNNIKNKAGEYIAKEMLAAQFLHWLCVTANGSNWVNDNLGVHKTFDDFIAAFNKENPIKDVYLNYCIGAIKEMKDNGYYKYTNMSLVTISKEDRALGLRNYTNDENISNLITYNPDVHIYDKTNGQSVSNFNGNSTESKPIEEKEEETPNFNDADDDIDFTPVNSETDDPFEVSETTTSDEEDPFAV